MQVEGDWQQVDPDHSCPPHCPYRDEQLPVDVVEGLGAIEVDDGVDDIERQALLLLEARLAVDDIEAGPFRLPPPPPPPALVAGNVLLSSPHLILENETFAFG